MEEKVKIRNVDFEKNIIEIQRAGGEISAWELHYMKVKDLDNEPPCLIFKKINYYLPKLVIGDWIRAEVKPTEFYEGIVVPDEENAENQITLANHSGLYVIDVDKIVLARRQNKQLWSRQ